jgi:hypothetical protein
MSALEYIAVFSTFAPVICGVLFFRALRIDLKIAFVFFVYICVHQTICFYMAKNHMNNVWLMNIENLVEALFFFDLFLRFAELSGKFYTWLTMSLIYIAFWVIMVAWNGSIWLDLTPSLFFASSLFMIPLFGWLIVKLHHDETILVYRDYRFWFAASVLIFYTLNFTYLIANNLIDNNIDFMLRKLSYILLISASISNLLFGYSFICFYRNRNSFT